MNYDIILFDADETLLDFTMAEKMALRNTFAHFDLPMNDEIERGYSEINLSLWKALERGEITKPDVLARRFRMTFERFGIDAPTDGSVERMYQQLLGEGAYLLPDALEVLKTVADRCYAAIVTNGEKHTQRNRARLTGIDQIVRDIFISEEIGAVKPNPEYFRAVFEKLGNPDPRRVLIVGDSLTSDMRGGENAGVDTCWFNPHGAANTLGVKITHEIRRLPELYQVIGLE